MLGKIIPMHLKTKFLLYLNHFILKHSLILRQFLIVNTFIRSRNSVIVLIKTDSDFLSFAAQLSSWELMAVMATEENNIFISVRHTILFKFNMNELQLVIYKCWHCNEKKNDGARFRNQKHESIWLYKVWITSIVLQIRRARRRLAYNSLHKKYEQSQEW